MKLHGPRKLGSTSVLLNNMDTYVKGPNLTFPTLQRHLELVKQTCRLTVHSSWATLCQNKENVTELFWSKWPLSATFDLSYLEKWPLERFNHIYLLICDLYYSKEAACQKKKKKKLLKNFWDWPLPPPSILTDGRTDGGQIGIKKAPLAFGWRS